MGNDNTILWLIGGAVVVYILYSQSQTAAATATGTVPYAALDPNGSVGTSFYGDSVTVSDMPLCATGYPVLPCRLS